MSVLEQELRALGAELDFPAEPDVTRVVRARLERRSFVPRRRALAIALAVLAVAVAAAMAVPSARTAILELLGLRGVTVERVEQLPAVEPRGGGYLGAPVSREQAEREAGFELQLPHVENLGEPQFFVRRGSTTAVSAVYGDPRRPRLLLTQFEASFDPGLVKKIAGGGTEIRNVRVGSDPGIWLSGEPHAFMFRAGGEVYEDVFYLAGNTLLWEDGPVTYRLEADVDLDEALAIARSVR